MIQSRGEFRVEIRCVGLRLQLRFERRNDFFPGQCLPIDVAEEWMCHKFPRIILGTQPMLWISVEQPFDKIPSFSAEGVSGKADFSKGDVLVHLLRVFGVEWTPTTTHLEDKNTERPEIHHFCIPLFIQQDLGSEVLSGTAERVGRVILREIGFGQAKVTEGNMAISIQQDILRLEIAIDDVMIVEMLQRKDQFCNVKLGPRLLETALLLQMPEELATRHVVRDQIKIRWCLEGKLEPDDEGRSGHGRPDKDIPLSQGMRNLFLLDDNLLRQDLHRVDTLRVLLFYLINLAECTFADELQNLKIVGPNVFPLGLFKVYLQVDFSRHLAIPGSSGHQREPALQIRLILFQIETQPDMAEESLLVVTVVNRDIDLGLIAKNVTINQISRPFVLIPFILFC